MNYGHVAVLTDADHDGYHIKGLLFNMFHKYWPELLKRDKFFLSIRTPIVGITHKRIKGPKQYLHSYVEFEEWQTANKDHLKEYEFDYYKGLGRHTAMEAREIFSNLEYVDYVWSNDLKYKWIDLIGPGATHYTGVSGEDKINEEPELYMDNVITVGGGAAAGAVEFSVQTDDPTPRTNSSDMSNSFRKLKPVESIFQPLLLGYPEPDYCDASLKLAFEDQMADYRKDWILKYLVKRSEGKVDYSFQKEKSVNYFDFINSELIEFSVEDNFRNIPNIMDGFKPSQRKIIYCCLRRKTPFKKIRVDQLAGNISENTNYHHGNESLSGAIILMAQDYVGSNNLNMLVPEGQFGTRILNGKDHAAPRYLCTFLSSIVPQIFDKRDNPLLKRVYDEGQYWEPEYYLPTLPLILINGACGIGTGFSTAIPCYNPAEIINNMGRFLRGEPFQTMMPFYQGFQGTITRLSTHSFKVTGCYERDDLNDVVTITEIPVGVKIASTKPIAAAAASADAKKKKGPPASCFEGYKNYIESLPEKYPQLIKEAECQYVDVTIKAQVMFQPSTLATIDNIQLEKLLKLTGTISTANMNLYNHKLVLQHYDSAEEILVEFMSHRLHLYEVRRQYMLSQLRQDCELLSEKARFISYEIDDENSFTVRKKNKVEAVTLLQTHNFKTTEQIKTLYAVQGLSGVPEDDEVDDSGNGGDVAVVEVKCGDGYGGYGYLVRMPIVNQTQEMIEKLNADRAKKMEEIKALEVETAASLYNIDLAAVQESYFRHVEEWNQQAYASLTDKKAGGTTNGKKRRVTRKKAKVLLG